MRLLHTADWHAGRTLRGRNRNEEIAQALAEVLALAQSERADAILVAGDLFDSANPSPESEGIVYGFFLEAAQLKLPCLVIAGNHDSGLRFEGLAGLFARIGTHVRGVVRPQDAGVIELEVGHERLIVAAMPFLSERRLVKAASILEDAGDVGAWRQKYRQGMAFFIERLTNMFRGDAINMLMLHTTLDGGILSNSERSFDVSNSYSLSPDVLPASAQYVALGHLHKPQQLRDVPPVAYSGSLIQLDFGEAGDQKRVNLIEASPGRPVKLHSLPLSSGKPLKNSHLSLDQLDGRFEELRTWPGYLRLVVDVSQPLPGLKDRLLRDLPNALAVELRSPEIEAKQMLVPEITDPITAYRQYCLENREAEPSDALLAAFTALYTQVHERNNGDLEPEPPSEVALSTSEDGLFAAGAKA
jgi:DNA repair protein SbcD/Mre11